MANRYGEAALLAARQAAAANLRPARSWEQAMEKLYATSPVAQKLASPRTAFLALCEAGLVKGIPAGEYADVKDKRAYAARAVALLVEGAQRWSLSELWHAVTGGDGTKHGSQMDIVLALWNNDLIVGKPEPKVPC